MATRTALLAWSLRILLILLCVICLLSLAQAQHGGGGGHSGGGHSGGHSSGAHSGASHAGGHLGWLRFWSRKNAGHGRSSAASTRDISAPALSNLGTSYRRPSIPATLLWSPPQLPVSRNSRIFPLHLHRGFFQRLPRLSASGCFFNGVTQVCFFEPFLPLLFSSVDAGFYSSGFDEEWFDLDDGLNFQALTEPEGSTLSLPANLSDDDTSESNSSLRPGATTSAPTDEDKLDNGVFLLVLNNGANHAVTDYWVNDGYLEYISSDGIRSHIPLEALDLQRTVNQNAHRGLPFVLRSAPQNP